MMRAVLGSYKVEGGLTKVVGTWSLHVSLQGSSLIEFCEPESSCLSLTSQDDSDHVVHTGCIWKLGVETGRTHGRLYTSLTRCKKPR